jgi:hypothetical protein
MGRYRQYPRVVRTQIPGAGVKAGKMVWGEQVMNLWGAPVAAFSEDRVPLLGLGQSTMTSGATDTGRVQRTAWAGGLLIGFGAGALAMHLAHKYHWLGMR